MVDPTTAPPPTSIAAAFQNLQSSWFRLETLQAYDEPSEYEPFAEFCRTGQISSTGDEDWQRLVTGHTQAGRTLQRVHIVEEPLTDYLRFELAAYAINHAAGEDIRLLPIPRGQWPEDLPRDTDYWLFDEGTATESAWTMVYDENGGFLQAEHVTDPATLADYRRWRTIALAAATPLTVYNGSAGGAG